MVDTLGTGTIYNIKINERTDEYDYEHCVSLTTSNGITLAEFKEMYVLNENNFAKSEEKPQPKFKMGDKVKVVGYQENCRSAMEQLVGKVGTIIRKSKEVNRCYYYQITCDKGCFAWREDWLEPYIEPEIKPTEDMEEKDLNRCEKCGVNSQQCMDAPCQNYPVEKELNLCELLKGHEGETFYSPLFGPCELIRVKEHTVVLEDRMDGQGRELYQEGYACFGGEVMLFPSRALYEQYPLDAAKTWHVWQEEQKKHWVAVTAWIDDIECESDTAIDTDKIYFRTPEDRNKCIEEIKAIIEKYSKK